MVRKPRHCLLFHVSVVSKTSCIHFSGQGSHYGYTHAWTKLHNEVMSWISGSYRCFSGFSVGCCINREKGYLLPTWVRKITFADVSTECSSRHQSIQSKRWLCVALTLKRTRDLMLLSVSSLPLSVTVLSCHVCVNLSHLQSRLPSRWHWALAVALHQQWAGHGTHATIQECGCLVFLLYIHITVLKIECAHLNFRTWLQVSKQASIHIHVPNAVMLVWGLLRLTPIVYRRIQMM